MEYQVRSYKPRSLAVKAMEVTKQNAKNVAEWCGGELDEEVTGVLSVGVTLSDRIQFAMPGDYVVLRNDGAFDVIEGPTFNRTYELSLQELAREGDMWPEQTHQGPNYCTPCGGQHPTNVCPFKAEHAKDHYYANNAKPAV